MRAMTVAIPVSIFMSVAGAAQEPTKPPSGVTPPPSAPTTGTAVPQAPVGHRQPTQGTLPPAVRKEEDSTSGRRPTDELGPIQNICKNC
jgi:hypothetical protein